MINFAEFGPSNDLLSVLPEKVFADLKGKLQHVELETGETLYVAGTELRHAYFPLTAVASLFSPLQDGAGTEVAVVGSEGVIGIGAFMGNEKAISSAVVLRTGTAWRISARDLSQAARDYEPVMRSLLRYTQALLMTMAQTSACHSHHSLHGQLCSWLLQHLDRQADDSMYVTQERIAAMLGVRRESITENALKLQKAGAIRYHRGLIQVLDRVELKSHCCECYSIVKTAFDNLKTENRVASTQAAERTLTALQAQEWGTCESTFATFDALLRRPQLTEYKRDTASASNGKSAR